MNVSFALALARLCLPDSRSGLAAAAPELSFRSVPGEIPGEV
jgi:hypothetical protein